MAYPKQGTKGCFLFGTGIQTSIFGFIPMFLQLFVECVLIRIWIKIHLEGSHTHNDIQFCLMWLVLADRYIQNVSNFFTLKRKLTSSLTKTNFQFPYFCKNNLIQGLGLKKKNCTKQNTECILEIYYRHKQMHH